MFKKNNGAHKIGLALSGGGTRGFAHIGVFKALEEAQIPLYCVAGTSVGSIMGAIYCAGFSVGQMEEESSKIVRKDILNKRWLVGSDSQNIANVARRIIGDISFADLKMPFAAVAVDLEKGEEVILRQGSVPEAVAASSAVPILFKPMKIDGKILVDGGLLNNMPADVCRQIGADIVVGVDLNYARGKGSASTKLRDTAISVWNITTKNSMLKGQMNSDCIVTPELSAYKNTRLENIAEMIGAGYDAAKEVIPQISELYNTKF